ncbi:MAG: carboxypeptidase regulatory-like domain-containing protein [Bacteroidetes bacterium]|nr:carboxypeptidase regulatory-like domain-containing protein [Bacteroidota bacterium]
MPFTNQAGGTVNQNASGTFATINNGNGLFTNAGTINLVNGNWIFQNTNSHNATSTINIAASRTLTFSTAPSTFASTVVNAGTIAGSVPNYTGPSFTNNGSVTLTNLPFAGAAAQILSGTGSINTLTINNANGVSLGGDQTINTNLTLTNGKLTLGANNLTLALAATITNQSAARYLVTDGMGSLRRAINGSNVLFPIGTATSYLPATLSLTSGPQETFAARVQNEVYSEYGAPGVPTGDLVVNEQVERTWTITEQTSGGNQATVQLQWNTVDEGANFGRSNCALHAYNGTDWVAGALGGASGSNPYTRSLAGVSSFREFTVADGESNLPFACPGGVTPGSPCDDGSACTTNDVIGVDCQCAGIFQDSDNDGTCNADDGCPNDVNKIAPGECGCGVADVPASYYVDADGDGYGTGALVPGFFTCTVPAGYSATAGDCDDNNNAMHPGAIEICDGFDNDCNGTVDDPTTFSNGLVAQWLFNGNLNDHSTNGNNGTAPGGASFTTGMDGTANGAFQFGGSRYVLVPHSNSLNLGTGDYTYSVWLNWAAGSLGNIFDKGESCCSPYRGLQCFVDHPSAGVFHGRNNSSKAVSSSGGLGNNAWHHIVHTRTGSTMRIYVDGVLNATATHPVENITTSIALFIGRNSASAIQFYSGKMDNLRLYNRALTAQEVTDLFAHEQAGNVDGVGDVTFYTDADEDGYGDPATITTDCEQPPGTVLVGGDCDDSNPDIHPGASEICDGIDNDCANGVDDGLTVTTWYADADNDGFGDPNSSIQNCEEEAPAGYVANNTDLCPADINKQAPGACGCGVPETDSDTDGTPDCIDGCPNDPLKTAPGQCGCGNADNDTDNDGIADCVDTCPGVTGQIGSACDDGLATTGNDVLDNACECHGLLIDCLGMPGGAALPGTACTVSNLPGIWSASCVCELEGPDVAVQNVSAVNDTIAPDQSITLNWNVANLGNAAATVNWTERYYMESGSGANRTLIAQAPYTAGTPLSAGASLPRSTVLTMPALINVGDDARFVVELVPGTGLTELPNSAANNTGTQATNWIVRKLLKLLVPQPNLTEGAVAGVPITVQRTGSTANALTVNIGIDESERFDFPTSITILAGQSARSFTLVATENALLEGTIPAVLTASSSGFLPATRNLTILDNESPALSFTGLPTTTGEGSTVSFQVATNFAPSQPLQVFLTSNAPTRFAVPASVTIAANTTSVPVNVTLPQDALPELDIAVDLTAGAAGHSAANASLQLTDDDVPGLQLVLTTDTVSESGGAFAVQAALQRTAGSPPIAFTAVLTPSLANTLLLPATVSLAANASQQTFTIGVIDNALVDGFRTVTINAAVQMAGCGCSAPPSTVANVNADLTVVDNDGPSLTVTVNPATLAEGLANAGILRVQRNTSTATALTVDLSSYDLSEITLPATAIIPIGALWVDVPITTVNDGTPDGSQQVYVQAAASGFAPGIAWCIVTDVNQPDLIVSALSASTSPWPALTPITWQATIANTGFANSIVGTPVRGVLSQNSIVDAGDIVLFDYTINTPVTAGGNVQISGAAVVPNNPGTHKLLIQVNPGASVSELTYTNNTSQPLNVSINPSYTATAQVAGTTFLRGSSIPVTGTAVRPDMSPAANEPIEVYVLTNGLRREVLTTTNASGAFTASFIPLANESGHYTIGACFPGMGQTTEQDAFDIHGVRLNNGQYPQFVVLIGDTLSGTLVVQNMSGATLTNLTLVPTNVPAGATFSFGTLASLAGGATANIPYEVSGTVLTAGFNYAAATLSVVSDQGTIQPQDAYYYCQVPGGNISADISSITTSVSQAAGQQLVQFRLMNNGAGSTGALSLSLPSVPWLTAMTPVNMPALAAGDTALVILRFLADAGVPFDTPINGTVVLNGANSNSLVLPFTFTKVSTTVGDLTVDAVNQFTFFDEDEPHVAGATVEVRHQYTNALLASGVTDANGLFTMTDLPEGTHRLVVSKPQHLPTEQLVTVNPGTSATQTVFIQYQAITFSWSVVPTQVQDQYDVQLNMVFQTNIPIPVVTIDMPDTMPELHGQEVFAFMATLTNHGLITAKDVTLQLQEDHPIYEFVTNYVPADLLALQSVQVPVLMRRREVPLAGLSGMSISGISGYLGMTEDQYRDHETIPVGCKGFAGIMYWYYCSLTTGLWTRGGELYHYLNLSCPDGPGTEFEWTTSPTDTSDVICPWCPPPPHGHLTGEFNGIPLTTSKKSCTECIKDVIESIADCFGADFVGEAFDVIEAALGQAEAIGCALNAQSAFDVLQCELDIVKGALEDWKDELTDEVIEALDLPNPITCTAGLIGAAWTCSNTSSDGAALLARESGSQFEQIANNLEAWRRGVTNLDARAVHYYGTLTEASSWSDLAPQIQPYVSANQPIGPSVQQGILASMLGTDTEPAALSDFFDRWNLTLEANSLGIFSPNGSYPNIIDTLLVWQYEDSIAQALNYAQENDYQSLMDMYKETLLQIFSIIDNDNNSVCASVTVQLSQTVTMTREAFTGTLDIFNGHPTDGIDSLSVNILITDPDGVPSNGLFQINTEQLTGLTDVTGTGQIPSQEHGIVQFLFIPEPGAAPTVPVPYGFGGSVTYWDPYNEEMTTIELAPITLTVNPSPDLMLHYFMERNILGDDALTSPDIEPSIPAELAVMIENHGYGAAQNMKISSAQPEIVENESGLAIQFELTGSNLQGQPANLGVLDIPFGTIPPHQTKVGQWWFTSSLLGKFVSYEASVVHANSFGNPELSLVQGVELHELTRSIREYGPLGDGMNDFLVNDQFDINDVPDIIYFSQGMRTAEVLPAESGAFNAPVSAPTFTNTLTVTASEPGWNHIKLDDPGSGDYDIVSVTRNGDGQSIPLDNAWLTFVTLPVSQQPVYEDKFHFVDTLGYTSPTSYTVVWVPKNTDVPAVDTIMGAPTMISATQVTQLTVVFDKPIDPATFTVDDLTLTFQGGPDLMSNAATITQVDPFTFTVDLTALTTGDGLYVFTAQAAGVTDQFGISGVAGRQVSWTQFISVPAIVAFQGLPNGTTDDEFTTIELLFNRPIDETSLTPADLTVLLGGSPQAGALTVARMNSDSTLFQVGGLENVMNADGTYTLSVDMPNVLSTAGVPGLQAQSVALTLDGTGPTVVELTPITTGGLDAQHRTGVNFRFSEPVSGLTIAAITITRDGNALPLLPAQLSQVDADEWRISNLGMASYPDGAYAFTVSASGLSDAVGNVGSGSLATNWTVDRSTPITVTNVGISPDLGISSTDGLTSTLGFNALFTLSEPAAQVTIAQTSFGTENVLATLQNASAGPQSVPVSFPTGGNTGLKVTAIGSNGGNASGTKNLYIDQTPLSATWQTANDQSLTADLTSATIQFSADLLDANLVDEAISFHKDGMAQPTGALTITPVNGSTYTIGGLASVASGTGAYALSIDLSSLHKASSGIAGQGSALLNWTVVPTYTALLSARVFLEGPYANGVMRDSLRTLPSFPLTEPFTAMGYVHAASGGGETTTSSVLAIPGNDAIVDWVIVELRDADDNSDVVASRCALLQRDGDVVATDGLSPVNMAVGAGSYHVAIRHRNHLGTMTEDTVTFASGVVNVDFTLLSTGLFGTDPQKQIGARRTLWAGDVTFDNAVQYTGSGNDRDPILVAIGGFTPNNVVQGYLPADVNLDGRVKYTGPSNDRDRILVNVGSNTPSNIRDGQLP